MDPRLVIRAQQGEEAAFAEITRAAYGRFLQVAYRVLRDRHLAEDATQQALVQIWRKLPRLRDPQKFDAWSYRLLVNACLAEHRRLRRRPTTVLADGPAAGDDIGQVGDRDQLERAFARLSVDHRAIVVLHHYLGLTIEEVAETLGIPVGTAASRLGRAMARLRLALASDAPGETVPNGGSIL
jgi:RNA polymerase sigma-70 factor (ECF subfamily)